MSKRWYGPKYEYGNDYWFKIYGECGRLLKGLTLKSKRRILKEK